MLEYDPVRRTRTLARIVGPFLIVATATIFTRFDTLPLLVPAYVQDAPLMLATGAFTLMAGLAMIGAHHHFTGAAAIAITVLSLAVCARGVVLMLAPETAAGLAGLMVHTPPVALAAGTLFLVLGLWLSFVGWFAGRSGITS